MTSPTFTIGQTFRWPNPQMHTIGWATVAMSACLIFFKKQTNVLIVPQCLYFSEESNE